MDFGVMFFASGQPAAERGRYRLLVEAARLADREGLRCVWLPERHFHAFGGLYPDPALLGAAVAMITERLEIRAGSLISPLHDSLRIAESWSVVDNLSGGRIAVSFGSGWNIDDFVFFPDNYAERQAVMYRQIEEVRALWRGEALPRRNSAGREVRLSIWPRPVQPELPVWVTASGNPRTFVQAGRIGANLLTHLLGQDVGQLRAKIERYREARAAAGFDPETGRVSLMLHTFLGHDRERVRAVVRRPLREYLRSAISLEQLAAWGGGGISGGHQVDPHDIPAAALEELLDAAFERYFETASLLGTVDGCAERIWTLREAGVDEIACLVDFIDDVDAVLGSLGLLGRLRAAFLPEALALQAAACAAGFLDDLEA